MEPIEIAFFTFVVGQTLLNIILGGLIFLQFAAIKKGWLLKALIQQNAQANSETSTNQGHHDAKSDGGMFAQPVP